MALTPTETNLGSSQHILSLIEGIADEIRESADESESNRTLSKSAVRAISDAGLFKTKLPEALGGFEADPIVQFEAIEAMTVLDTSAGWNYMIGAASVGIPGAFLSDEAIATIFENGSIPRFASVGLPGGQAIPENGGHKLTGRWPFASGVKHSEWIWCGALVPTDGDPEFRMFTFPLKNAKVVDEWHVSGLKGTGSCDVLVDGLLIPNDFSWNPFTDEPRRGGPMFKIGLPGILTNEHAAIASGVATRVLDEVSSLSKTKKRGMPPAPLSERGTFQSDIGKSRLMLEAARTLAIQVHANAFKRVSSGETLTPADQAKLRASATYITEVALSITGQMFRFAGASALHESSVIQRYHRDLVAAGQHFMVSDSVYEAYGKACLGSDDVNPMG